MKTSTKSLYYVLPEGATQEQQWAWDAIEDMCASGQFTAETMIFFPEKNTWVRAGNTELNKHFDAALANPGKANDKETNEGRETLEADYKDVLQRLNSEPDLPDVILEAARLAFELGEQDVARDYFQRALEKRPFNARVAQEIKRRYSKSECREFRYLDRPVPVWENMVDLATFPLSRGMVYPAVAAVTTFLFLLLPYGFYALAVLYHVWSTNVARGTAAGSSRLPGWQTPLENPVRGLVQPLLAGLAVTAEFLLVLYAVAGLFDVVGLGGDVSAAEYVKNSPVLVVLLSVAGIAYLPAVFVRLAGSTGSVFGLLNPWANVKTAVRMEQEYLMSVILLLVLGLLTGSLYLLLGGVPVFGKLVLSVVASYALPMAGFVLGRLLGRMRHVL